MPGVRSVPDGVNPARPRIYQRLRAVEPTCRLRFGHTFLMVYRTVARPSIAGKGANSSWPSVPADLVHRGLGRYQPHPRRRRRRPLPGSSARSPGMAARPSRAPGAAAGPSSSAGCQPGHGQGRRWPAPRFPYQAQKAGSRQQQVMARRALTHATARLGQRSTSARGRGTLLCCCTGNGTCDAGDPLAVTVPSSASSIANT
jgi:hypothetical protein